MTEAVENVQPDGETQEIEVEDVRAGDVAKGERVYLAGEVFTVTNDPESNDQGWLTLELKADVDDRAESVALYADAKTVRVVDSSAPAKAPRRRSRSQS